MRKKELLLIALIAAAALAVVIVTGIGNGNKVSAGRLTVYVDGREYCSSPLIAGECVTVRQEDGSENVIRMTENGFYMESATCPNRECIAQGEVTAENWRSRKLLQQVICLPNRVVVELELTEADRAADPDVPDF